MLMFFQTSYMNLGTFSTLLTIVATIIASFWGGYTSFRKFKVSRGTWLLLFFLIFSIITSLINERIPDYMHRLIGQTVLYCILASIPSANEKEQKYIWWGFIIALLFYAVLFLQTINQTGYYIHSRIAIFGTSLDPNFVGLPYVMGSILLLEAILSSKTKIVFLFFYLIVWITILFTASRGTFISATLGSVCFFLLFITKSNISFSKKLILSFLTVIICVSILDFVSLNMEDYWERAMDFGGDDSDNGRLKQWFVAMKEFEEHPLLGVGLTGMYDLYGIVTHNTYLALLSETGILGFVLFMVFVVVLLKKTKSYSYGMLSAMLGVLIHIAFLDALDNRCLWGIFCWIALLPNSEVKNTRHGFPKDEVQLLLKENVV